MSVQCIPMGWAFHMWATSLASPESLVSIYSGSGVEPWARLNQIASVVCLLSIMEDPIQQLNTFIHCIVLLYWLYYNRQQLTLYSCTWLLFNCTAYCISRTQSWVHGIYRMRTKPITLTDCETIDSKLPVWEHWLTDNWLVLISYCKDNDTNLNIPVHFRYWLYKHLYSEYIRFLWAGVDS